MQPLDYKVLAVDDSPIIIQRLREILSELPCITLIGEASGFAEAIHSLEQDSYDLVLLDINLSGKNGIELLSFIKTNYPAIKTVMLSNQSGSYYRNLCNELGSDSFIDKTSEFETIPQTINNYFKEAFETRLSLN